MAVAVVAVLDGASELQRALKALSEATARRLTRGALKAAAEPIKDAIKAAAPVGDYGGRLKKRSRNVWLPAGNLRDSIDVRPGRYRRGYGPSVIVAAFQGREIFYAPFVEFGHGIGKRTKDVRKIQAALLKATRRNSAQAASIKKALDVTDRRGRVPPHPFVRPAVEATKQTARAIFRDALADGVRREIKRLARKTKASGK